MKDISVLYYISVPTALEGNLWFSLKIHHLETNHQNILKPITLVFCEAKNLSSYL